MILFKRKCEYCRTKIDKGKEVRRDVKVPGYIGTHPRNFCCEGHAEKYEKEVEECIKKTQKSACCG